MGVKGLWVLLGPCGRRVPMESLRNKRLAIDTSIWLTQFVKAMRDEQGHLIENAHLLGMFRRICKLLFYQIRPVFVFDGGTPALKRRTVEARRRRKEQSGFDLRKTATRIVLNRLQQRHLLVPENVPEGSQIVTTVGDQTVVPAAKRRKIVNLAPIKAPKPPKRVRRTEDNLYQLPESAAAAPNDNDDEDEDEEGANKLHPWTVFYDVEELDLDAFADMPPDMQAEMLESLKKSKREAGWKRFSRLQASNPSSESFSQLQIDNVLRSFSMNKKLEQAKAATNNDMDRARAMGASASQPVKVKKPKSSPVRRPVGRRPQSEDADDEVESSEGGAYSGAEEADPAVAVAKYESLQEAAQGGGGGPSLDLEIDLANGGDGDADFDALFDGADGDEENNGDEREDGAVVEEVAPPVGSSRAARLAQAIVLSDSDQDDAPVAVPMRESPERDASPPRDTLTSMEGVQLTSAPLPRVGGTRERPPPARVLPAPVSYEAPSYASDAGGFIPEDAEPMDVMPTTTTTTTTTTSSTTAPDAEGEQAAGEVQFFRRPLPPPRARSPVEEDDGAGIGKPARNPRSNEVRPPPVEPSPLPLRRTGARPLTPPMTEATQREMDRNANEFASLVRGSNNDNKNVPRHVEAMDVRETGPAQPQAQAQALNSDDEDAEVVEEETMRDPRNPPPIPVESDDEQEMNMDRPAAPIADSRRPETVARVVEHNADVAAAAEVKAHEAANVPAPVVPASGIVASARLAGFAATSADRARMEGIASTSTVPGAPVVSSEDYAVEGENLDAEPLPAYDMSRLAAELADQEQMLRRHRRQQEREYASVTSDMVSECMELLITFGIPFITSPMEAEAQCAALLQMDLVDGIVTEDCDTFLFGGDVVYKNIFDQSQYVECYLMRDFETELGMTREKLIHLALLLGSDYTEGIKNIGPVHAMEVIREFPGRDGLLDFRRYMMGPIDAQGLVDALENDDKDTHSVTVKSLRKRVDVAVDFPSREVEEAYLNPSVDSRPEPFDWGTPDIAELRKFAEEKFDWDVTHTDEILLPAVKRYEHRAVQTRIEHYFIPPAAGSPLKRIKSKRVRRVVSALTARAPMEEDVPAKKRAARKPRAPKTLKEARLAALDAASGQAPKKKARKRKASEVVEEEDDEEEEERGAEKEEPLAEEDDDVAEVIADD